MNIKDAKQQIKNAMEAYFTKDEFGNYRIPIERQRPVFLMGPPGIGKTQIMEQVAQELGVSIVSYSMTHHTRQSALGLPFIVHKNYGGKEYDVSEYTMSEIIASVYDTIEETGIPEGILFLDEINCVSETLAPAMLQFLQYKIFGRHKIPDGWIVVTAGNPPEYNKSVREFDIVTWDRLKRIDVEPNFDVWKEYAYRKGIHASILTYLEIRKGDFYRIETTTEGKRFITARGWDDLSEMIKLYEEHDIPVDEKLVSQYVQNGKIAKDFSIYYDLYNKYKSDYQIDEILAGTVSQEVVERAQAARFDERLSLLGLLLESVTYDMRDVCHKEDAVKELMDILKKVKTDLTSLAVAPADLLEGYAAEKRAAVERGKKGGYFSEDTLHMMYWVIASLERQRQLVLESATSGYTEAFPIIKADFDEAVAEMKEQASKVGVCLNNVFKFAEKAFGEGQELLILVTELTVNCYGARFIARYGCDAYFAHNKELLFYERQQELIQRLESFDL